MPLPEIQRESFLERLEGVISAARDSNGTSGLLLVDLTNLRQINHRHSFGLGDALLSEIAVTLSGLSVLEDCLFRIGGHRFALIVPQLQSPAVLTIAVKQVRAALQEALHLDADLTAASIAIGLAVTQEGVQNGLALLTKAEIFLQKVRSNGDVDLDAMLDEANDITGPDPLERCFEEALDNNRFQLYYQPQIDLHTGTVIAAEALLRWEHEEFGFIAPERVIKLAEDAGLIYPLTKSLAHIAARQLARWWQDGNEISLSLNVPASLISQPELPSMLQSALTIWGAPATALTVEITEEAIVEDIEAANQRPGAEEDILRGLREAGLRIAIDDFGTGYSSLSYFRDIPARELKIDRSFIARMQASAQDRELIRIIIDIAHLFDMTVVAEGTEDFESIAALQQLGCDIAQGYYFARPMPAEQFDDWLAGWTGLIPASVDSALGVGQTSGRAR